GKVSPEGRRSHLLPAGPGRRAPDRQLEPGAARLPGAQHPAGPGGRRVPGQREIRCICGPSPPRPAAGRRARALGLQEQRGGLLGRRGLKGGTALSRMPNAGELRIVSAVRPQGRKRMSRKIVAIASCLVLAAAFSVARAQGTLEVIHSFGDGDGEYPSTELVMDGLGNLYGTTVTGGDVGAGSIFQLT